MRRLAPSSVALIDAYLRVLADALSLRDWQIHLDTEAWADSDNIAECHTVYGQQYARIRICTDFPTYSHEKQRAFLVHELIHCHLTLLSRVIDTDLLPKLPGGAVRDALAAIVSRIIETAVDNIATAVAPYVPLPEWETLEILND